MNNMDLDSAINVLETYVSKHKNAEYLKNVISELKNVFNEMERYNRNNVKLTILPWDED